MILFKNSIDLIFSDKKYKLLNIKYTIRDDLLFIYNNFSFLCNFIVNKYKIILSIKYLGNYNMVITKNKGKDSLSVNYTYNNQTFFKLTYETYNDNLIITKLNYTDNDIIYYLKNSGTVSKLLKKFCLSKYNHHKAIKLLAMPSDRVYYKKDNFLPTIKREQKELNNFYEKIGFQKYGVWYIFKK